jgi:acyl carrier protein
MTQAEILKKVSEIFGSVSNIDPSKVAMDMNIFDDVGIDSLDFLDIAFDIDKAFGTKLPIEDWLASAEQDAEAGRSLFSVRNLVEFIEKNASANAS